MKLLKTLVEAVASKSQMAAQSILSSEEQITGMARGAAAVLKKNFGERLMDTPMAMIVQQVRSYVDATTGTRLGKDGLEQVTHAVVSQLRPFLGESKVKEEDEGEEITEGKMAELDDDLTSLSSEEFKKKYGCSKKEMRKKASGDGKEEKTVKEAVDTVHGVMAQILDDQLDAYDVLVHPRTPGQRAAAKIIQRMYDSHTEGTGLHADDDVEQIMLNVYEDIEAQYGPDAGTSPFESVQEAEEEPAPAKKRGRPSKKAAEEKPAAKAKKDDDSDDEEDTKKVSSKALAKSMEKDDDGDEDDDVKKADKASKDAPKKIADTSVKPDALKTAYEKLSKRIQHAVDTSSATSAFELSKELRATFKDITTEEVKQATAIWKSEN